MRITLTTTGRRTGKPREVPLYAFAEGDRLVIVGSRGGAVKDPSWVNNLRAESRALISLGHEVRPVLAHEAGPEERDRL